ncbi:MAG: hypothetical protein NTX25_04900 [Proteobacteria bacterium]|nr:hypothetical protein [Pseudomonadota bacterium]
MQALIARIIDQIRRSLLGANNERIDFLMDSFYKLSPQHQTSVMAGAAAFLLVFVLGSFTIYFSRINALEDELNQQKARLPQILGIHRLNLNCLRFPCLDFLNLWKKLRNPMVASI